MIMLGQMQTLSVCKSTGNGVYLESTADAAPSFSTDTAAIPENRVLLPRNQVPAGTKHGDSIRVFVYRDSEDRAIATTTVPPLTLGETAVLTVKETSQIGAFLDWGLAKDLLLPFKEQTAKVKQGEQVLVALYIDKSGRLCATMHVYDYLSGNAPYKKDDRVTGIVYEHIDEFGTYVAVDSVYSALIPRREVITPLRPGTVVNARVTKVQPDGRLELSIREKAYLQMDSDAEGVLTLLKEADGFLPYHDKSNPEAIKAKFGLSKSSFKRAIGHLYKEGLISIEENGIRLL
ncbi:MAG: S1-like domain-containing RNA-binding protein [Lachnospiraceae bacterium]|nr:S1-like domain-containing RNA-binding protein [Lachnospiraceae bacterium]